MQIHPALIGIALVMLAPLQAGALERPDSEFRIFQFPANMIPRIDGDTSDWDMVPSDYAIGSDQLEDTVRGGGIGPDPSDLDITVRVGWVKGMNRLYFLYEAYDDYWNMNPSRGDIFEIVVDGDLSGGQFINNVQLPDWGENHFRFKGVHAQNYHIFTPPGEGRDWTMVWGSQPWIKDLPYANAAYSYSFSAGESGHLVLELWITPFDHAPSSGPADAVESRLKESDIIGLSWAVLDYDENDSQYEGFWNLSHKTRMDSNASCQVAFRLMPIEPQYRKNLSAAWDFTVIDMNRRLVAFQDASTGDIDSWLWDFGDGTTSNVRHPLHSYEKAGDFIVTLTISGPAGTARFIRVRDVAVK